MGKVEETMKKTFIMATILALGLGVLYAATNLKISRLTTGIGVIGGTTTTNGKTVVVSDSSTNEFHVLQYTATVAAAATAVTNTYTVAFVATPTIVVGLQNLSTPQTLTNMTVFVSHTQTIVTGLSTNNSATLGGNNVPFLIYGYTRSGVFE